MPDLSIGEIARRSGLSASAIRYYERSGLVPPAPRRSGRRCYDAAIVSRLRAIAAAREAGLGLSSIGALLGASADRTAFDDAISRQIEVVEGRIAALARLRAGLEALTRCRCPLPSACEAALGH